MNKRKFNNHISTFSNHTSESLKSYRSKRNEAMIISSTFFFVFLRNLFLNGIFLMMYTLPNELKERMSEGEGEENSRNPKN